MNQLDDDPFHVTRARLLDGMLASPVVVLEAGAGYGKSTLVSEIAAQRSGAMVRVEITAWDGAPRAFVGAVVGAVTGSGISSPDLPDDVELSIDALSASLRDGAAMLCVDDVHHLEVESAALLVRLVRAVADRVPVVVAGRRLPDGMERIRPLALEASFSSRDLALDLAELTQMCERRGVALAHDQVGALLAMTGGWPAACVMALVRLGAAVNTDVELGRMAAAPTVLRFLLDESVERLNLADRGAMQQCALLTKFSASIAEVLGRPGLLVRVAAAGVPISIRNDGWLEFPGPVADQLGEQAQLAPTSARAAASVYFAAGDVMDALQCLLLGGLSEAAAEAIVTIEPRVRATLEPIELQNIVDRISPDVLERSPRVLLTLARVAEVTTNFARRADALDAALSSCGDDDGLRREILAELAIDRARDTRTDEAEAFAYEVVRDAARSEIAARARAEDALGRVASWRGDDTSMDAAARHFEEAARLANQLGETLWEAASWRQLGDFVYFTMGRYDAAISALDRALELAVAKPSRRLTYLTVRAEVLFSCGRFEAAERDIDEVFALAARVRDARLIAYGYWERARHHSHRGDAFATAEALRMVDDHRGDWFFQNQTGAYYLSDAADFCDRVGLRTQSREYLARALARVTEAPAQVLLIEALVNARSGDPALALAALAALDATASADAGIEAKDRWLIELIRANAYVRSSDDRAAAAAAQAFEYAAQLGIPEVVMLREPALGQAVIALARAAGSQAALAILETSATSILRILGGSDVLSGGVAHQLPKGLPGLLAACVAAHGGRVHAEIVIDELFPDAEVERGGAQLRNVLNRLKKALENDGFDRPLVVRDGDTLTIDGSVATDMALFEREALHALANRDSVLARSALARVRGPVLPDEVYAEWAIVARERVVRLQVRLLSMVAELARESGNIDSAVRAYDELITLERDDEEHYLDPAELLIQSGRPDRALQYLRRAEAAMAELGLDLTVRARTLRDAAVRAHS